MQLLTWWLPRMYDIWYNTMTIDYYHKKHPIVNISNAITIFSKLIGGSKYIDCLDKCGYTFSYIYNTFVHTYMLIIYFCSFKYLHHTSWDPECFIWVVVITSRQNKQMLLFMEGINKERTSLIEMSWQMLWYLDLVIHCW